MVDWKQRQRAVLENRKIQLVADWEAANNQIDESVDLADRSRLERKAERLKNEIGDIESRLAQLDKSIPKKLHILTSAKGGVGKTLISLAAVCTYHNLHSKLFALDLNTMNPDLYRILYPGDRDLERNWLRAKITDSIESFRYDNLHTLPYGTVDFWNRIYQILLYDERKTQKHDTIVDTNLHVANLHDESKEARELIEKILLSDRDIYIWIIWTWVSFKENEEIIKACNRFKLDFKKRIRFIHVLNPTVLVPPQIDLNSKVSLLSQVLNVQHGLVNLVAEFMKGGDEYQQEIVDLIRSLSTMTDRLQKVGKEIEIRTENPFAIAGLVDLVNAPVTPYVDPVEFTNLVSTNLPVFGNHIDVRRDFFRLSDAMLKEYEGRPRNVLVISSHNPFLGGYTDYVHGTLPDIQKSIETIYRDVNKFLRDFDSKLGNPIE